LAAEVVRFLVEEVVRRAVEDAGFEVVFFFVAVTASVAITVNGRTAIAIIAKAGRNECIGK
jgi:hypothetical protein